MIHGNAIDEGGDDPNPSSCGGDGEDLGEALELEVEVKGDLVKAFSFVKRREKESEMKRIGIYRFWNL